MILDFKNVGKIAETSIEFNGITVIAGNNNTGKSTVGKMLYCIYRAFYHIDERVELERKSAIQRAVNDVLYSSYRYYYDDLNDSIPEALVKEKRSLENNLDKLTNRIKELLGDVYRDDSYEVIDNLAKRINSYFVLL